MGYRSAGSLPIGLHYEGPSSWPYRFLTINNGGVVNGSQDGLVWVHNATLPGIPGVGWNRYLCFSQKIPRAIVAREAVAASGFVRIAYTDDGDSWIVRDSPANGFGQARACKIVRTNIFGPERFYLAARDNGAHLGGLWYSDDGGLNFTAVAWPIARVTNFDVCYLVAGPDRVLVAGRFLGDTGDTWRIFFTTDGVTMTAGFVFTDFGFVQTLDGHPRGCAYDPTNDLYVLIGSTGSVFDTVRYARTVDGSVQLGIPLACGWGTGVTASYDALRVPGALLCASFAFSGPNRGLTRATPAFGWSNFAPYVGLSRGQLAYSPSLERTLCGFANITGPGDSTHGYSDDGGQTWANTGLLSATSFWGGVMAAY